MAAESFEGFGTTRDPRPERIGDRDPEHREARRHEKHRERSSKHERVAGDLRNKIEKVRKLAGDRDQIGLAKDRRRERGREREEFYAEDRESYETKYRENYSSRSGHPNLVGYHRDRRLDDRNFHMQGNLMDIPLSPKEKAEREKRMERFMVAEKQKELSQHEADQRRLRREEERREEQRIEELRHRAELSMLRNAGKSIPVDHPSQKHRKQLELLEEPVTVELISDDDDHKQDDYAEKMEDSNADKVKKGKKRKKDGKEAEDTEPALDEEDLEEEEEGEDDDESKSSSISLPTSDSDSSSSSSNSDDDEEADGDDEKKEEIPDLEVPVAKREDIIGSSPISSHSASSTDDSSDDKENDDDSDSRTEKGDDDHYLDESPIPSPPELKEQLPAYFPAIMGCRSVDEFECLNRIAEGTYGVVYRAREKNSNQIVALKRLKMEKEKEGFPITSLREVNTLLKGQHENIVTVREIVVGSNMDKIYIVMDYVEHDLKSLMETMTKKNQIFTIGEVKTLMLQLLSAVAHLHDNWILHRDLKTSNLLLSHRGILKVGDFGLAREYGSPLKQYTPIVVTLWYRAPELLLGCKEYSCPIDAWSLGCIFGELLGMQPMFPGKSEIDQLNKIFKELGTPSDKIWPNYSQLPYVKKTQFVHYPFNHLKERFKTRLSNEGFNLLNSFLTYDPSKRITCSEGLRHNYFRLEDPAPIDPAMFPTWPAKSENPHGREKEGLSPKPPSGGKKFKDLGQQEDDDIAGFFLGNAPSSGPGFTLKF